ncbi:MAG: hypothetical protein WCF62_28815 [Pseudolabrys sp.]
MSPVCRAFFFTVKQQYPGLSGLVLTRSVPIPVPMPSSFLAPLSKQGAAAVKSSLLTPTEGNFIKFAER